MKQLRATDLARLRMVDSKDGAVSKCIPSFKQLVSLDIPFCRNLRKSTVKLLPPTLRHLNLYACSLRLGYVLSKGEEMYCRTHPSSNSDKMLAALPRGLRTLHLSHNSKVTDAGLPLLPPKLLYLTMIGFSNVTPDGLEKGLPRSLIRANLFATTDSQRLSKHSHPWLSTVAVFEYLPM